MADRRGKRDSFYVLLSRSARIKLFLTIFLNFAAIGIVLGANTAGFRHWIDMSVWFVTFGGMAVFWAYTFMTSLKLLFVLIPAQIILGPLSGNVFSQRGLWGIFADVPSYGIDFRFTASLLGAALVLLGYFVFVMFISGEGNRTVRLQAEMKLAKGIHDRLVPEITLTGSHMDVYGKSSASGDVGGDLFDVLERGGRLDLYVADVSGHGVRAGMMMGMIKSTIRTRYLADGDTQTVIDDINAVIMQLESPGMFATFAGIQSISESRLRYCLAGHPPILHCRAAQNDIIHLQPQHVPIGVLKDYKFTFDEVTVAPGDVLVIVTDGILEIMDENDVEFEIDGVETVLQKTAGQSPREIYDAIIAAAHAQGIGDDDETVLVAKIRG